VVFKLIWVNFYSLSILKFDKFKMITSFAFAILLTSPHDINLIADFTYLIHF